MSVKYSIQEIQTISSNRRAVQGLKYSCIDGFDYYADVNNRLVKYGRTVDEFSLTSTGINTSLGYTPLSNQLTLNHIFVGNSSNIATDVAMSGDATIVASGALTLNTVNSNVGTWNTVTVNAKGLVTSASNAPYITLTSLSATSPIFYDNTTGVISSQAASYSDEGYVNISTQSFRGPKTFINPDPATAGANVLYIRNLGAGVSDYSEAGLQFESSVGSTTDYMAGRIYTKYDGNSVGDARVTIQTVTGIGTQTDTLSCKAGSVGIGVTTPTSKLHVVGSGSTSATYSLKIDNSSSSPLFWLQDEGHIGIGTNPHSARKVYIYDTDATTVYGMTIEKSNADLVRGLQIQVASSDNTCDGIFIESTAVSGQNGYAGKFFSEGTGSNNRSVYSQVRNGALNYAFDGLVDAGTNGNSRVFNGLLQGTSTANDYGVYISNQSSGNFTHHGGYFDVTSSTAGTNIAGYFSATAGTLNYALYLANGGANFGSLQTGNTGLATGDLYVDTAANILANGDLIVARKV